MKQALIWLGFALLMTHASRADVRLPKVIADNIVWQRGRATTVWGWADPGEAITASFAGQRAQTKTDSSGCWRLTLKPLRAGGPHTMIVQGHNEIMVKNILIGDVWVCSGQSKMG